MADLTCPNCEGTEIRIEVPAYSSYRPVRIEEAAGRRILIAEHYDSGESDKAGEFYCVECGNGEIPLDELGIDDWQDTERWAHQQARAKEAAG